jgi:hypothetical protein
MIEEIQLKPEYQRTMLLYEFCKFMKAIVPSEIIYIEAYTDKRNTNSQKLMRDLNMKIINDDGKPRIVDSVDTAIEPPDGTIWEF